MKIGIVRHFKVDYHPKKMMNSKEFQQYVIDYDNAEIIKNEIDLSSSKWDKCYCSDLKRAIITAKSVYSEELEVTDLLREVQMYPIIDLNIKIPSFLWSIASRIAWKLDHHSQMETKSNTIMRAKNFISKIDINKDRDILIVSHGFFLLTLVEELKSLGFRGDIPTRMGNGCLYILEK